MILCQFNDHRIGVVENGEVRDVTSVVDALPNRRYPLPLGDLLIENLPSLQPRIAAAAKVTIAIPVSQVKFLSPVANPSKVVAAPVNYQKHLEEAKADAGIHNQNKFLTLPIHQAGLFLKATSSIVGPSEGVAVQHADRRTDHEVELAVVIGKHAKEVAAKDALNYVAGYCIGLDISVRGSEDRSFRKSLDSYTVLGPWMVTADQLSDPSHLDLEITVNGEIRQKANTRNLILGVPELIEFASSFYTLLPGDIILTGTPEGVGPIAPGDVMHAKIESIGEMDVPVRAA